LERLEAPGRDLTKLKGDVLEKLATAAWYLHSNRDGKLFFKNVENLNAKLESLARAYVREQSLKELRQRLSDLFKPVNNWGYQDVLPLPAIDEIELTADRATLVISEPYVGQGLNPHLKQFWDQTTATPCTRRSAETQPPLRKRLRMDCTAPMKWKYLFWQPIPPAPIPPGQLSNGPTASL
jgi:hypothetical protein